MRVNQDLPSPHPGTPSPGPSTLASADKPRRVPVSCFLITRDAEDFLEHSVRSVADWVDEIIVVDSGSTDRTREIAASFGARVIEQSWLGYGPQKQVAERACRNDWVLNIDADEVVTPELAREIQELFRAGPPDAPFFALPRPLVYPGRSSRAFAMAGRAVRLYDRRRGGFSDLPVHEGVDTEGGPVRRLEGTLLHYSASSLHHLTEKNLAYARIGGLARGRATPLPVLYLRLFTELPMVFLRSYVVRGHGLNGAQGFAIAVSTAFCSFMRVVAQLEARGVWTDRGEAPKRLP
jgi:glycosyltransferase involved in cell wall biosynthesis